VAHWKPRCAGLAQRCQTCQTSRGTATVAADGALAALAAKADDTASAASATAAKRIKTQRRFCRDGIVPQGSARSPRSGKSPYARAGCQRPPSACQVVRSRQPHRDPAAKVSAGPELATGAQQDQRPRKSAGRERRFLTRTTASSSPVLRRSYLGSLARRIREAGVRADRDLRFWSCPLRERAAPWRRRPRARWNRQRRLGRRAAFEAGAGLLSFDCLRPGWKLEVCCDWRLLLPGGSAQRSSGR
jgi:hypothetical protein